MHFKKSIVSLLVFTLGTIISFVDSASFKNEPYLIDSLRRHYLSLENDLWRLIESGTDTGFVLSQIHIIHHTFLNENFHERNISLVNINDDNQNQLFDVFNVINISVSVLLKNYLHKEAIEIDERKSIRAAQEQETLVQHLDKIYNITGLTDFYKIIKDVSCILCLLYKSKLRCF